jgi:hypothetical protein
LGSKQHRESELDRDPTFFHIQPADAKWKANFIRHGAKLANGYLKLALNERKASHNLIFDSSDKECLCLTSSKTIVVRPLGEPLKRETN